MLPFLASELEALIRNITSRFIKPEVVKVCNTLTELAKFDTKLDQNNLSLRRLTLNLRPEELFRNSWTVTAKYKSEKLNFFLDCQRFLDAVLVNLIERCLHVLGYPIVRQAVMLDPLHMPTGERPHRC